MTENREQLLSRKDELFLALRLLEQDYREGLIDDGVYRQARVRYEGQAAEVLRRLDELGPQAVWAPKEPPARSPRVPRTAVVVAGALIVAAVLLLLVSAVHSRGTAGASTSSPPPTPSRRLMQAERAVIAHPHRSLAYLELGNAYLDSGQANNADASYRRAMELAPSDPQPATLHAMVIGYRGQEDQALNILHGIERTHPTFARAWLLDGVFSSRTRQSYPHALTAWRQFLRLQPRGTMSSQVRQWVRAVARSEHQGER